jgi:hypothetical protein
VALSCGHPQPDTVGGTPSIVTGHKEFQLVTATLGFLPYPFWWIVQAGHATLFPLDFSCTPVRFLLKVVRDPSPDVRQPPSSGRAANQQQSTDSEAIAKAGRLKAAESLSISQQELNDLAANG